MSAHVSVHQARPGQASFPGIAEQRRTPYRIHAALRRTSAVWAQRRRVRCSAHRNGPTTRATAATCGGVPLRPQKPGAVRSTHCCRSKRVYRAQRTAYNVGVVSAAQLCCCGPGDTGWYGWGSWGRQHDSEGAGQQHSTSGWRTAPHLRRRGLESSPHAPAGAEQRYESAETSVTSTPLPFALCRAALRAQ